LFGDSLKSVASLVLSWHGLFRLFIIGEHKDEGNIKKREIHCRRDFLPPEVELSGPSPARLRGDCDSYIRKRLQGGDLIRYVIPHPSITQANLQQSPQMTS
jgi:hypothetical protein